MSEEEVTNFYLKMLLNNLAIEDAKYLSERYNFLEQEKIKLSELNANLKHSSIQEILDTQDAIESVTKEIENKILSRQIMIKAIIDKKING